MLAELRGMLYKETGGEKLGSPKGCLYSTLPPIPPIAALPLSVESGRGLGSIVTEFARDVCA